MVLVRHPWMEGVNKPTLSMGRQVSEGKETRVYP